MIISEILSTHYNLTHIFKYIPFRFPVAIKTSKSEAFQGIEMILDEAKTMIEIGAYHNHIVNLQGVTYSLNLEEKRFLDVRNDINNYLN